MKQIIYLGGKKAREYDGVDEPKQYGLYEKFVIRENAYHAHISALPVFDVIGDCDWKKGDVKTELVDYEKVKQAQVLTGEWLDDKYLNEDDYHAIVQAIRVAIRPVPIPKKQEGESQKSMLEEIEGVYLNDGTGPMFDYIEDNFILTRKS